MATLKHCLWFLCLLVGITSTSCTVEGYTISDTDADVVVEDPLAVLVDGKRVTCQIAEGCYNPNANCEAGPLGPPPYCRWKGSVPDEDAPWGSLTGGFCRTDADCSTGGDRCMGSICVAPATDADTGGDDDDTTTDTDTTTGDTTGGFDCSQCFQNETCNTVKERCELSGGDTTTTDTDTTTGDTDTTGETNDTATTTGNDTTDTDTTTGETNDTATTTGNDTTDTDTTTGGETATECTAGSKEFRGNGREVGVCTRENRVCGLDGMWGEWQAAVGPTEEVCDGLNNDCDGDDPEGDVDEGCLCKAKLLVNGVLVANQRACDGGPTEVCYAGVQTCELTTDGTNTQWGACVGRVEACTGGATCQRVNDAPVCACPAATPDTCSSTCVDKQTDEAHCGVCGNACAAGQECSLGVCSTPSVAPAATMEFTVIAPAGLDMTGLRFRGTQTVVGQSSLGVTEWKLILPVTAKFQVQIVTATGGEVLDSFGNPYYACRLEKKGGKQEFWATGQNDSVFAFKGLRAFDADGKEVIKPWKVVSTDKAPFTSPQFVGQCEFTFSSP